MLKKIRWKELIIAVALPLAVGALSAWLTRDAMKDFENVAQPPLSPPMWVFPVAWTLLYVLMGIASYLVYTSGASEARIRRALSVYGMQLAVNFFWSTIFFTLRMYLAAFVWLVLLWVLVAVCIVFFRHISKTASRLLLPYLAWLTFAGYLNIGVWLLNR